jgi:hypothetical protein
MIDVVKIHPPPQYTGCTMYSEEDDVGTGSAVKGTRTCVLAKCGMVGNALIRIGHANYKLAVKLSFTLNLLK